MFEGAFLISPYNGSTQQHIKHWKGNRKIITVIFNF